MDAHFSRRKLLGGAGVAASGSLIPGPRAAETRPTPKVTLWLDNLEEASLRRVKQLGVDHVSMGGPRIPWNEAGIRSIQERLKSCGLTLANMMFGGFNRAIYGRSGRDEDIDLVRQSIRAAGQAGLPVMEYNSMRIARWKAITKSRAGAAPG